MLYLNRDQDNNLSTLQACLDDLRDEVVAREVVEIVSCRHPHIRPYNIRSAIHRLVDNDVIPSAPGWPLAQEDITDDAFLAREQYLNDHIDVIDNICLLEGASSDVRAFRAAATERWMDNVRLYHTIEPDTSDPLLQRIRVFSRRGGSPALAEKTLVIPPCCLSRELCVDVHVINLAQGIIRRQARSAEERKRWFQADIVGALVTNALPALEGRAHMDSLPVGVTRAFSTDRQHHTSQVEVVQDIVREAALRRGLSTQLQALLFGAVRPSSAPLRAQAN